MNLHHIYVIHTFCSCSVSVLANLILIFLILKRTPFQMKTYSVVLLQTCCIDLWMAFVFCFTLVVSLHKNFSNFLLLFLYSKLKHFMAEYTSEVQLLGFLPLDISHALQFGYIGLHWKSYFFRCSYKLFFDIIILSGITTTRINLSALTFYTSPLDTQRFRITKHGFYMR